MQIDIRIKRVNTTPTNTLPAEWECVITGTGSEFEVNELANNVLDTCKMVHRRLADKTD